MLRRCFHNRFALCALLCLLLSSMMAHATKAKDSDPSKPKPAKPPKIHAIGLGAVKRVPYTHEGDPAGYIPGEKDLRVRPLVVDTRVKDWTTGEPHDVTERSFAVRRALRINDALPTDKGEHWVWQRGPWILVDRTAGHITPLKLPDYDPAVSDVQWFRDYAAYCGLTSTGRELYAVVSQIAVRKPILVKKLAAWDSSAPPGAPRTTPACAPATWQREPLRITFQPTGAAAASFDLVGSSAVLVEEGDPGDTAATDTSAPANKLP
jgi:hypothetical protein